MNNYTSVDKIFHNFIFSSKLIQKSLYEIQSMLFKNEQKLEERNHIFITGMQDLVVQFYSIISINQNYLHH